MAPISSLCFFLLLSLSQWVSATVEDGLLVNGDFETVPAGGFPNAGIGEGTTSLPGWTLNGTVELVRSGQKQGGMILIVPQGDHAVRLGNEAEMRQEVELEKGSLYSVTFSAARTCAQLEALNVSVVGSGGASQTVDLQTLYSVEGWDAYAWAFQADSDRSQVAFKNPGMEDDPTCGPIIDNIAIKKLFTPDSPQASCKATVKLWQRFASGDQFPKKKTRKATNAFCHCKGTGYFAFTADGFGDELGAEAEGGKEEEEALEKDWHSREKNANVKHSQALAKFKRRFP